MKFKFIELLKQLKNKFFHTIEARNLINLYSRVPFHNDVLAGVVAINQELLTETIPVNNLFLKFYNEILRYVTPKNEKKHTYIIPSSIMLYKFFRFHLFTLIHCGKF